MMDRGTRVGLLYDGEGYSSWSAVYICGAAMNDHLLSILFIPAGLKKVTNDMKTYKNPELRASSVVKAGEVKKTESKPARSSAPAAKKPPVCTLQGKRWLVVCSHT